MLLLYYYTITSVQWPFFHDNLANALVLFNINLCTKFHLRVSGRCYFSDTNISQGNVVTHLTCSSIFCYRFARNLLLSLSVKELWTSVSTWQFQAKI